MASVLARLAPEKPLVDPVVQIFLGKRAILECLLLLELVHGVEHSDWAEANCTGGQLMAAAIRTVKRDVCIATLLVLLL